MITTKRWGSGNDLALNQKWCLPMQQFSGALLPVILHLNMADRPAGCGSQVCPRLCAERYKRGHKSSDQIKSKRKQFNDESSRDEFESIADEVNAQFQIPRQASWSQRTATAATSTIVPATSFNPRPFVFVHLWLSYPEKQKIPRY